MNASTSAILSVLSIALLLAAGISVPMAYANFFGDIGNAVSGVVNGAGKVIKDVTHHPACTAAAIAGITGAGVAPAAIVCGANGLLHKGHGEDMTGKTGPGGGTCVNADCTLEQSSSDYKATSTVDGEWHHGFWHHRF
jgi:hypothetical protein